MTLLHALGYVVVSAVFYLVGKLGRDESSDVYHVGFDTGFEAGWDECERSVEVDE